MACNRNRTEHKIYPNTIPEPCGNPLGFPTRLDLIAWDKNVYDEVMAGGGYRMCGDSWVPDATGSRGVLSNDMVGNASEDPVLYEMAKRRYYKKRPTYPYKVNSIYNKPYFNIMTGESNYTSGELASDPQNKNAMMASIGLSSASSPFDYPNESTLASPMMRSTPMSPTIQPAPTGGKTVTTKTPIQQPMSPEIPTMTLGTGTKKGITTPLAPDLGGNPMIPASGPGSTELIDGYPTIDTSGGGGGGGGLSIGGEMPMGGGEEEVIEEEINGGGKTYAGLNKKQALIGLILLVVAYYWWKNKK